MLRLFVAVDLPAELRDEVAGLMDRVHKARWANAKQLHITLRFIGDTPEEDLHIVRHRLASIRQAAFGLRLHRAGVFPEACEGKRRRPPRVIWFGIEPAEDLARLKQSVDAALSVDRAVPEQAFSPHLTLARFTTLPDHTLWDFLARHRGYTSAYWWVRNFHLYQSTLRREGAIHACVASYPLAQSERAE